jgi:hypothetical protein
VDEPPVDLNSDIFQHLKNIPAKKSTVDKVKSLILRIAIAILTACETDITLKTKLQSVLSQLLPLSAGRRGEKKGGSSRRRIVRGGSGSRRRIRRKSSTKGGTSRVAESMVDTAIALIWAFLLIPLWNFDFRFNRLYNPTTEDIHRMKDAPMWIRALILGFHISGIFMHDNIPVYVMLIYLLSLIGTVILLHKHRLMRMDTVANNTIPSATNAILNAPDPMTPDEFESHLYQQAHDPRNLRRAQTAVDTGDISSFIGNQLTAVPALVDGNEESFGIDVEDDSFTNFPPIVEDIVLVGRQIINEANGMGTLNSATASIVPSSSAPRYNPSITGLILQFCDSLKSMVPPPHVATAETASLILESIPDTVVVDELQIRINGLVENTRIINGDNPPWAHLPLNHARPYPLPSRIGEEEMERISEQQNRLTLKWERDRNEQDRLQEEVEREKKRKHDGNELEDEQYYRRRRERQNRRTLKRKRDRNERAQLQEEVLRDRTRHDDQNRLMLERETR